MARNFYVVLGVSRDADSSQIRAAHRRLVRIHHPDAISGSAERFTEVQEAYETLSDASQRRKYDRSLEECPPSSGDAEPRVAAPGYPERTSRKSRQTPVPALYERLTGGLWGAVDELFEGFVPGFFTTGRTASRRKDLYVELVLEPDEAARGGLFPLEIPVMVRCGVCDGTGASGTFHCHACRGRGGVPGRRAVEISIPARLTDGTRACLSLEDIGLSGVDLNVLVSIRPS